MMKKPFGNVKFFFIKLDRKAKEIKASRTISSEIIQIKKIRVINFNTSKTPNRKIKIKSRKKYL